MASVSPRPAVGIAREPREAGGSTLYLSPKPIHNTPSGWEGLEGAAIEINRVSGEKLRKI